jgi:hypothetical protein
MALIWSTVLPPECRDDDRVEFTEIHNNAHKCITGRMQHIQNAPS